MKFAMSLPDAGRVEFTVLDDGRAVMRSGSVQQIIDAEDLVDGDLSGEMDNWMILAHLAGFPFVGQTPTALSRDVPTPCFLPKSELPRWLCAGLLCKTKADCPCIISAGMVRSCVIRPIVEPITYSIYGFLRRDSAGVEDWLDEAIDRKSFPLLARIEIALLTLVDGGSPKLASWANEMLVTKVRPALRAFPGLH